MYTCAKTHTQRNHVWACYPLAWHLITVLLLSLFLPFSVYRPFYCNLHCTKMDLEEKNMPSVTEKTSLKLSRVPRSPDENIQQARWTSVLLYWSWNSLVIVFIQRLGLLFSLWYTDKLYTITPSNSNALRWRTVLCTLSPREFILERLQHCHW